MVIRGRLAVESFLKKNAAARKPFNRWLAIVNPSHWSNIMDMRQMLPTADAIKGTDLTCFNIGGNNYRLIAWVSYRHQEIVIRQLMTHAQYTAQFGS
jgi:mRNA interferase HigB